MQSVKPKKDASIRLCFVLLLREAVIDQFVNEINSSDLSLVAYVHLTAERRFQWLSE